MSLEEDAETARRAVDALEQACRPVTMRFGDTIDSRRLRLDIARLRDDLTLLCGAEPPPPRRPYAAAAAFFTDADDEGIGGSGRTLS